MDLVLQSENFRIYDNMTLKEILKEDFITLV